MICLSKDALEKEKKNIEMLSNGSVDGVLISVARESLKLQDFSHFNNIIAQNSPVVFFDRVPNELMANKVIIDDIENGYKAAKHLVSKGCSKLAILTNPEHVITGKNRKIGFIKYLDEYNIAFNDSFSLQISGKKKEEIEPQIGALFNKEILPDGIFAINENFAVIAMKFAHKKGLNVPKDLKIIAFTDGMISKIANPPLTTIAQHGYTMGVKATELLLDQINTKKEKKHIIVVPTNIVEREST